MQSIATASCMMEHIPEDVDFVPLDTITNVCPHYGTEVLVRCFLAAKSQPLILMVSNLHYCRGMKLPPGTHKDRDAWQTCSHCIQKNHTDCDVLGHRRARNRCGLKISRYGMLKSLQVVLLCSQPWSDTKQVRQQWEHASDTIFTLN